MKWKQTLAMLLVLTFVFACMPHAQAFYDTVGLPTEKAIERWNEYGVILGYDGYFRPDDSITRAEMAAIIDRIGSYPDASENTYKDLGQGWYTEPVLKVSAAGIILGYDGYVRPFDTITRAEAVIMLARTFSIREDAGGIRVFDDAADIPDWAKGYVGSMAYAGTLPFGSSFRQDRAITRAEVVQILDSLVGAVYNEPGIYTEDVQGSALISASDVTLSGATVTGDLYISGEADNVSFSGANVMGKVYYMAGPGEAPAPAEEAPAVTEEPTAAPEPADAAEPAADAEPAVVTGDYAADFDLSHTGTQPVSFTVYGGQSLSRIFTNLESRGICSASELFRFCLDTDLSVYYPFLRESAAVKDCILIPEGYVVPGVYEFHAGSTPALVMKTLLDAAAAPLADIAARAGEQGYTLHELLTIASIIEKEVGNTTDPDRATAASVIYNRLNDKKKLQMNVTRDYLKGFPEELGLDADRCNEAYNTYLCAALPAGPICAPRTECVEAALNPYTTNYFFFRSDSYGNIYYAETYEGHLENGQLAEQATAYMGYLGGILDPRTPEEESEPVPGPFDDLPAFLQGGSSRTDPGSVTVLIDAGHGGNDKGANIGEIYEKDINLSIAQRVRDILLENGIQVLMIRTDDTYSAPQERADLANELRPDLYLSIHCNSTENKPDIYGIETFVYPDDTVSRRWAEFVQGALIRAADTVDRGVKEGKLIVLHYTNMPAILVETGFMTNSRELMLLCSDSYQQTLAKAIAEGTLAYLQSR